MAKDLQGNLTWLKPILLDPDKAGLTSPKALATTLRRELATALFRPVGQISKAARITPI